MSKRILVIEDSEEIAALQRSYLVAAGYTVVIAVDGENALTTLHNDPDFDLMIVDYNLPDTTGLELIVEIGKLDRLAPWLFMTAAGNEEIAVAAMKLGALDYIVKNNETIRALPTTCEEVLRKSDLEYENRQLMEELRVVNDDLRAANQQLEKLSTIDDLTGIFNRRLLMEVIGSESNRSRRSKLPMCFAILDLDHFKVINDSWGHLCGDLVLQQFASYVKERLRRTDTFGRYGGEEFGIVLVDTPCAAATALCDEIRTIVSESQFGEADQKITVTCSIGLAELTSEMDVHDLIEAADKSLYAAKEHGRNRVVCLQVGDIG